MHIYNKEKQLIILNCLKKKTYALQLIVREYLLLFILWLVEYLLITSFCLYFPKKRKNTLQNHSISHGSNQLD